MFGESSCNTLTDKQLGVTLSVRANKEKKCKKKGKLQKNGKSKAVLNTSFTELVTLRDDVEATFRRNLQHIRDQDSNPVRLPTTRATITTGINVTYRSLEKNLVHAVILAADVDPPTLVAHVSGRCQTLSIPICKISDLRKLTKDVLGFSIVCLGLRDGEKFKETIDLIRNISPQMTSVNSNTEETIAMENSEDSVPEEKQKNCQEFVDKPEEEPLREFQYLKRSSKLERVFIPDKTSRTGDFISIANQQFEPKREVLAGVSASVLKKNKKRKLIEVTNTDWNENVPKKKSKISYVPPKVNRVSANMGRKKKKTGKSEV